MSRCLVCFPEIYFPLFSIFILLVLPWLIIIIFTGNPFHSIKRFIHIILAILSSTSINSYYVDLREFTLSLVELLIIAPFTKVNIDPVWLFMLACTANATSMYHVKVFVSLASSVITLFLVTFNKIITSNILSQFPSFASLTLEDRN